MCKKIFALALLIFVCSPFCVSAYYSPGKPAGYVNDFAELMSPAVRQDLGTEVERFKTETHHEIAVVTIPNMQGDYIENFSEKLFKEWGIGLKESDNGVLLLIAKEERAMRIEVGYGLEGILTDTQSMNILRDFGKPYLKDNDYDKGIPAMVGEMERIIKEERVAAPVYAGMSDAEIRFYYWVDRVCAVLLGILVLIGITCLTVVGRSKRFWVSGVWGALVGLVIGILMRDILATVGCIIFIGGLGLLFDYIVSRKGWFGKGGGSGGSDSGGGYSGGSSSSSSSSGSSGGSSSSFGGGSSGGGGASSSF